MPSQRLTQPRQNASRAWAMSDDRDRLLSLFTEHRAALTRFLARRLGNATLAEDLTQETWLRAARSEGVGALANPRGYLFRIAANLALDHLRHVGQGVELQANEAAVATIADPAPSPESVALHRAELARLLRAVDALPPRCREVFRLHKFEGLSYAEVAARLGIAKNTVMVHMVKALAALEQAMDAPAGDKSHEA